VAREEADDHRCLIRRSERMKSTRRSNRWRSISVADDQHENIQDDAKSFTVCVDLGPPRTFDLRELIEQRTRAWPARERGLDRFMNRSIMNIKACQNRDDVLAIRIYVGGDPRCALRISDFGLDR
jgi:hypothetical protein